MIKPPVTIKDIADRCGMSVMTVSRALRHGGPVSPGTRATVLAAAESLGYRPNGGKGRPRRQADERQAVAVLLSTDFLAYSIFYSELILAIESELGRNNHECVIRTCNPFTGGFHPFLDAVGATNPYGTLVVGSFPPDQTETILSTLPRPVLVDHFHSGPLSRFGSVNFDNVDAARQAVEHLLAHGRRRIALLRGQDCYFAREMTMGYREALASHGVEAPPELVFADDFTGDGGLRATGKALDRGVEFDGLFTTDEMAFGACRALAARGLTVGRDVAVFGCDGLSFGKFLNPPLSTIELDRTELGKAAVRHLFAEDAGESCPKHVRLSGSLLARGSCGCGDAGGEPSRLR